MSRIPNTIKPYIDLGKLKRQSFNDTVDEFFDDFDSHVYIRGQAGIGKTYTVKKAADDRGVDLCSFSGNVTPWVLTKQIAVACYIAGWPGCDDDVDEWLENNPDSKIAVHVDDCKNLFKDDMIDILKIALEDRSSDKLVYGSSLGGQLKQATEIEQAAIAHFIRDGKSGFEVPFHNRVRFIFTMNRELSTLQDVTHARDTNKSLKAVGDAEDRYAIFSRLNYEDLLLDKNENWGWVADLLLNEKIIPGASTENCEEMLMFCYHNWDKLTDMSVRSIITKLWKPMSKHLKDDNYDYLSKWQKLVV